jgi:hypothetical protein
MPAKASAGTKVIPLIERDSVSSCVGQEPDRTSGAPSESPLNLQPPKATAHGKAEVLLVAARRTSRASTILFLPSPSLAQPRQRKNQRRTVQIRALVRDNTAAARTELHIERQRRQSLPVRRRPRILSDATGQCTSYWLRPSVLLSKPGVRGYTEQNCGRLRRHKIQDS